MQVIFEFQEDWSQFSYDCNWRTVDLVKIEVEDDRMFGAWEITVKLMGVGFRFRHIYTETDEAKRIARQVADFDTQR